MSYTLHVQRTEAVVMLKAMQHHHLIETDNACEMFTLSSCKFVFHLLFVKMQASSMTDGKPITLDADQQWFLEGLEDEYGNDSYVYDEDCCTGGDVCEFGGGKKFEAVFMPVIYSVALVVGILGNGVLLVVLAQSRRAWSVTDTFILHLGVADVLLLMTLPFWTAQAGQADGWTFGTPLCKITGTVFTVRGVQQEHFNNTCCFNANCMMLNIQQLFFFGPSDQLLLWDLSAGLH